MTGCVGCALMGTRVAFSVGVLGDGLDCVVVVDKGTPTVLGPKHTAHTNTHSHTHMHTQTKVPACAHKQKRTHLGKSHAVTDGWNLGIIIMSTFRKLEKIALCFLYCFTQARASHAFTTAHVLRFRYRMYEYTHAHESWSSETGIRAKKHTTNRL